MKKIIPIILILFFNLSLALAQTVKESISPIGKWKFEAPTAPVGYNSGSISISFAENKYSTIVSLTGSEYAIPGDKTKFENDSVSFIVLLEGNVVSISLKAETDTKMTGKAVYSEGEIPLTLTKDIAKK